jgi:hypothetical protein
MTAAALAGELCEPMSTVGSGRPWSRLKLGCLDPRRTDGGTAEMAL